MKKGIPNKILLEVVKSAIKSNLGIEKLISKYELVKTYPEFVLPIATFVTINKKNKLRGCIGSLVAHQELYNDLVINARKAAFNDPRFKPLEEKELEEIEIEISILTPMEKVEYSSIEDLKTKITPKIDGVFLMYNNRQSTYLPTVWEQIPDFETFFSSLIEKGQLEKNCLTKGAEVFKYQTNKIKEK